jgi:hypothetical protein
MTAADPAANLRINVVDRRNAVYNRTKTEE